jgi:hypothetical protein
MSAAVQSLTRAPAVPRRALLLVVVFGLAAVLLSVIHDPIEAAPRWPTDNAVYSVDGWLVSAESVDDSRPGLTLATRVFVPRSGGDRATLVITSSPNAKAVFRAGAAVPFLGNGFTVEPAPVAAVGAREAFIARRGSEAWLQISVYGERRGQFGSGVVGWTLSTVDSLLGRENDYYLARLVVPFQGEASARDAVVLAEALFPRLAAYYAAN